MAEVQALELYEQSKDPSAALAKYREIWSSAASEKGADSDTTKEENTPDAQQHNEGILDHLSSLRRRRRRPAGQNIGSYNSEASVDVTEMLSTMATNLSADEHKSKGYNQLVVTYNLGLVHYSSGKTDEALNAVLPYLHKIISHKAEDDDNTYATGLMAVAVRIAFLVLDCIVRKHDGDGLGILPLRFKLDEKDMNLDPRDILIWLEKNAIQSTGEAGDVCSTAINKDELKFRVHLYKSKLLFIGTNTNSNTASATKKVDNDLATRTRISRKELKSAMDLYQNKLSLEKQYDKNEDSLVEKSKPAGKVNNSRGGSKAGGSKLTRSRGSNQSDVSSVTSVAGGSLVTSTSEGLWATAVNADKGGVVASATFEGMPSKTSGGQQVQSQQQQEGKAKKDNPDLHVQHAAVLYLKANLECLRGNTTKSLKLCSEARLAGRRSRGDQDGETEDEMGGEDKKDGENNSVESQMASHYDEAIYYNNLALVHQSAGKVHLALHYYSFAFDCMSKVCQLEGDCPSFVWSDGISRPDITAEILCNTSVCAFQAGEFSKSYESMARCMSVSAELYESRPRCWLRMGQSCIGIHTKSNDKASGRILSQAAACLYKSMQLSKHPTAATCSDHDCYQDSVTSLVFVKMEMNDPVGALEACKLILDKDQPDSTSVSSRRHAICRLYAAEAHCLLGDMNSALMTLFDAKDIDESQLKSSESLLWVAQGFAIERKKKTKNVNDDGPNVQVRRLLENQALLYQKLKERDAEAVIIILRGGVYGLKPLPLL